MHTWIVSNQPVGHFDRPHAKDKVKINSAGALEKGDLTLFLKGRIMMGQADIKENELGVSEFKWLAKEEIQKLVPPKYWESIDDILPSR
jgi:large subunit ribosomal protein L46